MAKLSEDVKRFIVRQHACFKTPSEIVEAVREVFDLEITRQQAHDYNPEARHKAPLAKKWVDLHKEARKDFLENTEHNPISHAAWRLQTLYDMAMKAKRKGNFPLTAQLLEQAAKERGNAFTNKHEFTGKNGGPIQFQSMTDEQLDQMLAKELQKIHEALGKGGGDA